MFHEYYGLEAAVVRSASASSFSSAVSQVRKVPYDNMRVSCSSLSGKIVVRQEVRALVILPVPFCTGLRGYTLNPPGAE